MNKITYILLSIVLAAIFPLGAARGEDVNTAQTPEDNSYAAGQTDQTNQTDSMDQSDAEALDEAGLGALSSVALCPLDQNQAVTEGTGGNDQATGQDYGYENSDFGTPVPQQEVVTEPAYSSGYSSEPVYSYDYTVPDYYYGYPVTVQETPIYSSFFYPWWNYGYSFYSPRFIDRDDFFHHRHLFYHHHGFNRLFANSYHRFGHGHGHSGIWWMNGLGSGINRFNPVNGFRNRGTLAVNPLRNHNDSLGLDRTLSSMIRNPSHGLVVNRPMRFNSLGSRVVTPRSTNLNRTFTYIPDRSPQRSVVLRDTGTVRSWNDATQRRVVPWSGNRVNLSDGGTRIAPRGFIHSNAGSEFEATRRVIIPQSNTVFRPQSFSRAYSSPQYFSARPQFHYNSNSFRSPVMHQSFQPSFHSSFRSGGFFHGGGMGRGGRR